MKNPNRMVIECPCGKELILDRVGGVSIRTNTEKSASVVENGF